MNFHIDGHPVRSARLLFTTVFALLALAALLLPAPASATITEFPTPTYKSFPEGITLGPDGALWFTEFNGFKIGRITVPEPTSPEQCKDGGWRNFPQFKNQGQCVAFVEHGK